MQVCSLLNNVARCDNREYAVTDNKLECVKKMPTKVVTTGPSGEAFVNNAPVSLVCVACAYLQHSSFFLKLFFIILVYIDLSLSVPHFSLYQFDLIH